MGTKQILNYLLELHFQKKISARMIILYLFYWVNSGKLFTQNEIKTELGWCCYETICRCNRTLKKLGLMEFEKIRVGKTWKTKHIFKKLNLENNTESKKVIYGKNYVIMEPEVLSKCEKYIPLAKLLYTEHKKHDEYFLKGKDLKSTFNRWADSIRLLVEKDGRDINLVKAIIKWCQMDGNFWIPNILSGKKLREKFPTLYAQYKQKTKKQSRVDNYKHISKKVFNEGVDLKELIK